MIILKAEVSINGIEQEIVTALVIAGSIWERLNRDLVVTSVCDGRHSTGSLHYVGHAIDFRISNLSQTQVDPAVNMLRQNLGKDFDVVLEADHIHVEFQPKKGNNL